MTVFLTGLTLAAAARRLIDEMTRVFRSPHEAKHAWLVLRGARVDLRAVEPADVPTGATGRAGACDLDAGQDGAEADRPGPAIAALSPPDRFTVQTPDTHAASPLR